MKKRSSRSGIVNQGKTSSLQSTNHVKKQKIEEHAEALFAMVNDIKIGFFNQSNEPNSQLLIHSY